MKAKTIKTCDDCEFKIICTDAHKPVSVNCNMIGKEVCERACHAVRTVCAIINTANEKG